MTRDVGHGIPRRVPLALALLAAVLVVAAAGSAPRAGCTWGASSVAVSIDHGHTTIVRPVAETGCR